MLVLHPNDACRPMLKATADGQPTDPAIPDNLVKRMAETAESLAATGALFAAAINQRQAKSVVVDTIADVIIEFTPRMTREFSAYCATCFYLQKAFARQSPGMQAMRAAAATNPLARQLPLDAFVLAPIQRLARYPMLVQAVVGRSAKGAVPDAEYVRHS